MMDTQSRTRPSLEVSTDFVGAIDGLPRTAFRTHRSILPSPSPLTAKPLPSPLHSTTPAYDGSVRQHEMGMFEGLDGLPRSGQGSAGGDQPMARPLSPIVEQAMATRVVQMSMESPMHRKAPTLPVTAPATPSTPHRSLRTPSMAEETRSMLLSGMTASQANNLGSVTGRRQSVPSELIQNQRRSSLMTYEPEELRAFGHVYLGNAAKADVFVAPCHLRRQSTGGGQAEGIDGNRLSIRARIRPRSTHRKPFVLARSFELDGLRATLPPAATSPMHAASRRQSAVPISPEEMSSPSSARTPTTPLTPGRRRSSAALRSGSHNAHLMKNSLAKEMSVHLPYARAYLPALAALMLSGHVNTGDSIDLPMPHPEAWPQTLAYVYTCSGEVTEAIRQNIWHLGGKV